MNLFFFYIIVLENYEDWGLKSILIGAVIALAGVVAYLYKSKEKALIEHKLEMQKALDLKDARIMEVINDHTKDLKEANNDMKIFVEKYHQFTQHLKDVVNAKRV